MQLAVEYPEYATGNVADPAHLADSRYGWFAMNALLTADTVHALVGDDPEWRQSATMLITRYQPFVRSPEFPYDVFNSTYLAFVREQTQDASLCLGC